MTEFGKERGPNVLHLQRSELTLVSGRSAQTDHPDLIRLLLVEDNPDYATVLTAIINTAAASRFEVVCASDLNHALAQIATQRIQVVLLDLSLPDSQGLETFLRLRAAAPGIPTLIMSGVDDEEIAVHAVQQGAQDYLLKGTFDGQALVRAVRYAIERRRAEEALRQSEEQLKLALEASNLGIWNWDANTGEIEFAGNHERLLGIADGRSEGHVARLEKWIHPDDLHAFKVALQKARDARLDFTHEFRVIWPDNSVHWILARGRFYYSADGAPVRMTGALSDISDRVSLEQQLFQSQKMEAIGKLAGGIAHDFNNLLTIILGRTELALREIPADAPLYGKIDMVHSTAERAAALTKQLLAFSRRHVIETRVMSLNAIVSSMYEMLRRLIGEHITLVTGLSPEVKEIKADPAQIEQVLINLVVNARDAMPEGGDLRITTGNFEMMPAFARTYAALPPGPYVRLTVADTGCGMTDEIKSHIFEPFFTTKPQGKGTGLGLSMVYGIVKQSNGYIYVGSEPARGTTFTIFLPVTTEKPTPPAAVSGTQSATSTETILLVEDETGVRQLVSDVLSSAGYTILEAEDVQHAIALCTSHPGSIELLLTDVVMPGMNGGKLADVLRVSRPQLKIVYMSGYTDSGLGEQGVLSPETHFLQKPFTHQQLKRKIRDVLDGGR